MTYSVEIISKRILEERKRQGLSQTDLGKKVFVSGKQISNYEKAITEPPLRVLLELCKVFSCELGFLLGEETYSNRTKLETAVQTTTGLSGESIRAIQKVTGTSPDAINFGYEAEEYKSILNQMFSSKYFILLMENLYELKQRYTAYHNVFDNLEKELGQDIFQEAIRLYKDPTEDYINDPNAPTLQPEQYAAISKIDSAIDEQDNLSYMLKISRYEVRETFESLISEMYPRVNEI